MEANRIEITGRRRHATAFVAIDKSWSMDCRQGGRTRLDAATEGACNVLDALQEDDLAYLVAFGSSLDDISEGLVETSAQNKAILKNRLQALKTNGQTALYDTVLVCCQQVLKLSAVAKAAGTIVNEDMGTFWLVVLTDGDDTCSKTSQADVEEVLRKIASELGAEAMKAMFIGVALESGPRRKLEALARAGGPIATFVDARSMEDIAQAFSEIAVQIRMTHVRVEPVSPLDRLAQALRDAIEDDAASSWPGDIQKGSHVRCVGQSRGGGSVSIGSVGVIHARDSDGDYIVNFPTQDNWYGRPRDLVLDTTAEKVRPGALVAPKSSLHAPKFGWGCYKHGMHGLVHKVNYDGVVLVQFGLDPDVLPTSDLWKSQLSELEVVDSGSFSSSNRRPFWPGPLQLGQAVRVPLRLDRPSSGWGSLQRGEVGYVRSYQSLPSETSLIYTCDFPSVDGWKGRAEDLEVEAVATVIRPGKEVRLREGVEPKYGIGVVSRSSVGKVRSISYDGRSALVQFPEDDSWKGTLTDIETLDRPPSERLTRSSVAGVKDCTGGHGLKPYSTGEKNEKVCDFCGKMSGLPGSRMYCCRLCDCDACERCYRPVQKFPDGAAVVIKGLQSREGAPLNGKTGRVVSRITKDRYTVQLLGYEERIVNIKESCLMTPVQRYVNGSLVTLRGLASHPEHNGAVFRITGFNAATGRYNVASMMCSTTTVAVLPTNFEVLPAQEVD